VLRDSVSPLRQEVFQQGTVSQFLCSSVRTLRAAELGVRPLIPLGKPTIMTVSHPILFDGSMVLVAGGWLYNAIHAVRRGEISVAPWAPTTTKRADDPLVFWFDVLLLVVGAIALVWVMFYAQR
jgi:hypothetical protein